ncbi:MAG: acyltransferase family protein [Pseudomonadota bacterium]
MTSIEAEPGAGERLHALDAVRAGALLLGVAFHATLTFLPGPQIWVVRDAQSAGLGDFFFVAHLFRMTAFFLIAGYFGRMLLHRRGTGGFIRNRLARIALPAVTFWPIVMPGIIACFIWGGVVMSGGAAPATPPPPPPLPTLATFPLTHLWFLYMLLVLYAGTLLIRGAVVLIDRKGRLREGLVDSAMRRLVATPAAAVVLAAPVALAFALKPMWFAWGGIPTPDTGFVPNVTAVIGFGTAFGFGWLLQRQRGLLDSIARWWAVQLAAAVVLTIACLWQLGDSSAFAPMPEGNAKLAYAACYALAMWSWTLGLTGAALRFLSKERPAVRYVADASYWIYLVHLPVVMALQVLVFPLALPAVAKWGLVVGGAFLILIASYHLAVRHSFVGRWLNGRKYPWRKPAAAMEAQPA